jgi:hypothetical protein
MGSTMYCGGRVHGISCPAQRKRGPRGRSLQEPDQGVCLFRGKGQRWRMRRGDARNTTEKQRNEPRPCHGKNGLVYSLPFRILPVKLCAKGSRFQGSGFPAMAGFRGHAETRNLTPDAADPQDRFASRLSGLGQNELKSLSRGPASSEVIQVTLGKSISAQNQVCG